MATIAQLRRPPETDRCQVDLVKLWAHECCRVFKDRLVDEDDHAWFDAELGRATESYMNMGFSDKVCPDGDVLLFCDFLDHTANVKHYTQVTGPKQLKDVCAHYLHEYNSMSTSPMELVLFYAAIEHVAKVNRVHFGLLTWAGAVLRAAKKEARPGKLGAQRVGPAA